jgi:hypothetical protein
VSEFIECQSCGRRFFAERLDCPYCGGGGTEEEEEEEEGGGRVRGAARSGESGLYGVLFIGFMLILGAIAIASLLALLRPRAPHALLVFEAGAATAALAGLAARRRWGRALAIVFIVANATLGVVSVWERGQGSSFAWGPGPIALLLFLLPFLSPQARDRFSR